MTKELRELVLGEALSPIRTPQPPPLPHGVICKWNILHI